MWYDQIVWNEEQERRRQYDAQRTSELRAVRETCCHTHLHTRSLSHTPHALSHTPHTLSHTHTHISITFHTHTPAHATSRVRSHLACVRRTPSRVICTKGGTTAGSTPILPIALCLRYTVSSTDIYHATAPYAIRCPVLTRHYLLCAVRYYRYHSLCGVRY